MPMLTGMGLAITIDVLIRVSFVLAVSLMLAYTTRWNAALRHAILVAGLAAVFIVPGATLAMRGLPVPRWQLGWLSRAGIDGPAEIALVSPQPPNEPQYRPARRNQPAPAIVRTRRDEARLDPGHGASAQSDKPSLGPRAWSRWNALYGRLMASCLLWTLLSGAIVKVIGLGLSLVRLRRIVARAHPVTGDHILSVLELIQGRIPMRQPPRLLESAEVSSPVAAGIIGNYVLLPTGWAGNLLLGETLAVLGHESAHLARRDHHVVIFQELLASLLWFHPLVHRLNRMLNRVREELCDNYAISLVDRASYCEALLHLAVGRPGASLRGATSMWPGRWSLEDRVRGILDERRPTDTRISNVARSATAICSLAMCGFIALPQLTASPPNDRFVTVADGDSPPRAKASLVAHEMTRSITRAFPVTGEKMLRFENLAGRVELVPGKRPTVEVEATVRVGGLAEGDVRRLIDEIGWVEVPAKDGGSQWGLSFRRRTTRRSGIPSRGKRRPTPTRCITSATRFGSRTAEAIQRRPWSSTSASHCRPGCMSRLTTRWGRSAASRSIPRSSYRRGTEPSSSATYGPRSTPQRNSATSSSRDWTPTRSYRRAAAASNSRGSPKATWPSPQAPATAGSFCRPSPASGCTIPEPGRSNWSAAAHRVCRP